MENTYNTGNIRNDKMFKSGKCIQNETPNIRNVIKEIIINNNIPKIFE